MAATPTAPARQRDVELGAVVVEEAVELRGGAMADHRTRAAGQHGRHPMALAGQEPSRRQRVDAVMDSVKAAGRGALLDCIHRKTHCD